VSVHPAEVGGNKTFGNDGCVRGRYAIAFEDVFYEASCLGCRYMAFSLLLV
jgi:hypothetical protein